MTEPAPSPVQLSRRSFLAAGSAFCLTPTLLPAATGPVPSDTGASSRRLDTGWQFYQGPLDPRFQVWHSQELVTWQEVTVPHCFNALDACDPDTPAYRGPGWYRTELPVANPYPGGRTLLHFEATGQRAEVYVGTVLAGTHSGGYDEYTLDITELCQGASVQLAVLCDNGRDLDRMPSDLSDFTLYGGLYRPVHLVYVPAVSVRTLYTQVLWQPGEPAQLSVRGSLYAPGRTGDVLTLQLTLFAPDGSVVLNRTETLAAWAGERELAGCELASPVPWSPDAPKLYRAELRVSLGGDASSVSERFGVRHVRFAEGGPFFFNGVRLPIRGTHRHEDFAGYAAAVPDELTRQEMQTIKRMGANFVRLAHYQQSRLTLDLCDELGLMVWEELPWCRSGVGSSLWQERGRTQLGNMIEQHRNHPSIVLWGLGNEDDWPGEFDGEDHAAIRAYMTELRELAHRLDPTRLTSYRRADFARDIPDVYSPSIWSGWYSGSFREYGAALEKARASVPHFLHVEFGADSHAGRHAEEIDDGSAPRTPGGGTHATRDHEWSETYACELFDWYLKTQGETPWLTGAVQWAFKDFTTPLRVGNPVPRVNQKGVVTRDMQPKEGFFVFQSYWSAEPMLRVYGHSWPVRWGAPKQVRTVRVYSNCAQVELFLNGRSLGVRHRDPADFPCAGLRWETPFQPGENTLRAEARHGAARLSDSVQFVYQTEPWGKPSQLRLVRAGDSRMEATLHDAHGVLCLDASQFVRFSVAGDARLKDNLGTPTGSRVVQMYNGRAAISFHQTGAAVASVASEGIAPAFLELPMNPGAGAHA